MDTPEPIVVTVNLALSPVAAFDAFTRRFADWWPATSHSLSRQPATRCRLEARLAGVVEECAPDGSLHAWGEVQAFEPGRRIRFSWHPGREPETAQWIEVTFDAMPGGSCATLTHGGWEALGEIGPLLRQEYAAGWQQVFGEQFAGFAARHDPKKETPP